jgi:Holliday junction resolvase
MSRDKGARGEREVAAIFRHAGLDVDRVPNSGGLRIKGDLYGPGSAGLHVETKLAQTWKLPEWLRQTEGEAGAGEIPVLAFRRNGERWWGTLPLAVVAQLLAERKR